MDVNYALFHLPVNVIGAGFTAIGNHAWEMKNQRLCCEGLMAII